MSRWSMNRRNFAIALLSAWAFTNRPSETLAATLPQTAEVPMHTSLTIDLQTYPNLQFRVDAFTVPETSRTEFETLMRRNLSFIETLPGFMSHLIFEKSGGPTDFNIVTLAVWENEKAIAAAGERVRADYQSIGFDMPAKLAALGIKASLGYYHAPLALQ
jgi:heme oxygenase (mycobilin-producing)